MKSNRFFLFLILFIVQTVFSQDNLKPFGNIKLAFDPEVVGGNPSLWIVPGEGINDTTQNFRIISYALDSGEKVLQISEVNSKETTHFVLPNRNKKDILGVRVEKINSTVTTQIASWRAMYIPGGKVTEYQGSTELKAPADMKSYWDETKKELAKIPINPEITPVPEKTTSTGKLYKVKLNSFNNIPILCWYYVPKDVDIFAPPMDIKKHPAIQIMPGYGSEEPPLDRTADGFITLSLNPRGHGPSGEYFKLPEGHHLWNIDNPEKYYYRSAYMDCVRGIDFLMSRSEVDTRHVGVEGGSQGGALTLAVAALDHRVVCAAANVPYLSNFPDFIKLATNGSSESFATWMNDSEKGSIVKKTLSYIDVSNLAGWIECPTEVCVGLQDRVCPPLNGIVVINHINKKIPKRLVMDPAADHEVPPFMRKANMEWYQKYLLSNQ